MLKTVEKNVRYAVVATKAAVHQLFKPIGKKANASGMASLSAKAVVKQTWWEFFSTMSWAKFESWLFPNMPEHYPFSKKLGQAKATSPYGKAWDVLLVIFSVVACGSYVSETYLATYDAVQIYSMIELVVTQFFAADFLFNFMSAPHIIPYLLQGWTLVDVVTILPVYISMYIRSTGGHGVNLSVFRFVRILRLVRIMRMFKLLNGLSGIQRQLVTLMLTLVSLVFMAAGIIHIMENDLKQVSDIMHLYYCFASGVCGTDTLYMHFY